MTSLWVQSGKVRIEEYPDENVEMIENLHDDERDFLTGDSNRVSRSPEKAGRSPERVGKLPPEKAGLVMAKVGENARDRSTSRSPEKSPKLTLKSKGKTSNGDL